MTRNPNELSPVFSSLKLSIAELKEFVGRESFIPVSLSPVEKKKRAIELYCSQFLKLASLVPRYKSDAEELTRLFRRIVK